MDAIELLRADHERVLAMLDQLERAPTARSGADDGQLRARKDLVTDLVITESRHEAVEEQYFWPFVRDWLLDGEELADQAVAQEAAAKQVLHALDTAEPDDADYDRLVQTIIVSGREHVDFEQTQVWPKLRAVASAAELADLGQKMASEKEIAPTRPHPGTSPNPAVQKTVGGVAAVADKFRDAVTGRGRRDEQQS